MWLHYWKPLLEMCEKTQPRAAAASGRLTKAEYTRKPGAGTLAANKAAFMKSIAVRAIKRMHRHSRVDTGCFLARHQRALAGGPGSHLYAGRRRLADAACFAANLSCNRAGRPANQLGSRCMWLHPQRARCLLADALLT